ncbi:hypothetical protein [Erythrobacter rubeus]|uniref:Uncharacterized protein n=1 Tax=Erythrobacter rubeus TaxID=2760803 RepID=A0ABR8KSV1_9SPHN|nr:hypothetical protein [Erythrobacter rubeus]MBD2841301.1 hypothetical protein [Erythrobacter rubeus]
MNKLVAFAAATALGVSLAACSEPTGEDTADLAPEAVSADLSPDDNPVGDGGAPELENVQAALDQQCPTLRARVGNASCVANELGSEFTCDYAFAQDPAGTERSLTIAQNGASWELVEEPDFCGSLERANLQADMATDAETAE